MSGSPSSGEGVALVALAGRFPGADSVEAFWANLCAGAECIRRFTPEELAAGGAAAAGDPNHVPARGVVEKADWFDAAFFGYTPREAELIDPQHRVFLECASEALERAGCDPRRQDGLIGVFGGASLNTYAVNHLYSHPKYRAAAGSHQVGLANEKDYLTARVSYKLDLRGPSLNVQTACATSLTAVCVACQSLLSHQCDLALAGGASLLFPQAQGYVHQPGGIFSPDGHCRAFDAEARGTVPGDGVAVVALKRLADAQADGNRIYAVIKGFAFGNDGALKVGFAAPSADGQMETVMLAQGMAGVDPATIGYVEAHGTATVLGDPIELASLTQAFRAGTDRKNFCAIGSVKSNIGHLDAAAGAAGLIKAALALHHRRIPPSLHFKSPNPQIDFADSAFYVADHLIDWSGAAAPRRAGVSSMGMGGTNVHLVLEEAPPEPAARSSRATQVLPLSAKTSAALDRATANLAAWLRENPGLNLADVAWTLQAGRREFAHRRTVVARDIPGAVTALEASGPAGAQVTHDDGRVVFLFTGQGSQKVNMGRGLYEQEPVFRAEVDRCAGLLRLWLGFDLRTILYPAAGGEEAAQAGLDQTRLTQPALFVFEYALARLWMSWGVTPAALLGHSLGEYVAGCLAGVFSLEDALGLVATRARLMQEQPAGSMLAVRLPEAELRPSLPAELSIATLNSVQACVVSGPTEAVAAFEKSLADRGVGCKRLHTSHAYHSAMMEPALAPFEAAVAKVRRAAPAIPMLSNVTGTWLTAEQATSPAYWASHIRQAVRFADGVGTLCAEPGRVFLEIGPEATLAGLVRQHPLAGAAGVVASLGAKAAAGDDLAAALRALGELWLAGARVDWARFHAGERRRRVLLPTYPFERQRHCIEPAAPAENPLAAVTPAATAAAECIVAVQVTTQPDDSVQGRLTALFSEVSGIDLARHPGASFASLGFDSLLLAQAAATIRRRFGVTILFGDLLGKLGTVRDVADFVTANAPAAGLPAPVAAPAVTSAPPTEAQREIWLASQVSQAASCAYNETRRLRFRGPLRRVALHAALQRLVDRHDALRTRFSPDGGEQRIAPRLTLDLPLEATLTADEAARAEAETPFDLENGPLVRARLLRLGEDDHVLFLTIHHLVCDGQAWGILLEELAACYRGNPALPPPPLQIGDYARSLATRAAGEEDTLALAYWCGRFSGGVPAFELPADRPRPARRNFEGGREDRLLPAGLRDRLRALGAQRDCTFFHTMLAAFHLWLRRLGGEADIVIGVPVAERSPEGADRLVAHCIDFMPVRFSAEGSCAFGDFLARTKEVFMEALAYRQCSFGRIVRALDLPYDSGRHPLTTVTFNVSRMREALDFGDVAVDAESGKVNSLAFDLSFNVVETGDELRLDCRYSRALFDPDTIRRWLGHFETLLTALAEDPSRTLDEAPLLNEAGRRQILVGWNATATDYPRHRTIHGLFAEQAALAPAAVAAVYDGGRTLGYGELDRRANQLAHHLRGLGVGPGSLVGFCLERSPELLVALLGILKAGGAYVSFDPTYPPARLALMIEDARPAALLTTTALGHRLPETAAPRLRFDGPEFSTVAAADGSRAPDSAAGPESLAYVSFTSGSTGRPKGVCVPHRGVVRLVRDTGYARFSPDEVFLQFAPVAFDASTFEIWGALLNGARLVLFPAQAPTLAELGEAIQRHGVTTLWLSAGLFQQVVEERCECLKGVRQLLAGGDVLSPPHARKVLTQFPGCRLINGYGPTENTTFTCCHPITAQDTERRAIPIGRPIANTRVYVLDERRQPLPIGIPGELYTGGDGLAQGYLRRPELTAEKFVPDPFGADPAARLYRTGDRVRWLADGSLDFLGRIDSQVKIRGFRVEPDEIEHVLARHPGLRACAIVAQAGETGDKRLVACLVAASAPAPAPAELRRFLAGSLPEHLVPAEPDFVFLDALPLDPNGKVDRRALAAGLPAARPAPAGRRRILPRDAVERQLVEIWEEILGVRPIGLNDRFFELGGHSLLAMRLLARIETQFGRRLPLAAIFEAPGVGELATLIRGHDFSARSSLVAIRAEGSRPPLFLVHGVGGGMFWGYANLARHLGADQPLYAFKSRGLDGEEEFGTIEEMAAAYVADLRVFQPQGPYFLGGYCFGGNVACEMARQLRAAGEEVGRLVLMNCVPHGGSYGRGRPTPAWVGRYLSNLYGLLAQLHASGPEAKRAYFRWKWGAIRQRAARWLGRQGELAPEFAVGETVDLAAYSAAQRRLWAAHVRALCQYEVRPFDGRVVLLRSRLHQHYCSFADDCGWGEFARGGVSVGIVPGAHESILEEPHVALLAKQLRACLERRGAEKSPERDALPAELADEARRTLAGAVAVEP